MLGVRGTPATTTPPVRQWLDLDGVVQQLGWEQFALCGFFNSTPVAIAYAARCPKTVTNLIPWGPFARGAEVYPVRIPAEASDLAPFYWSMLVSTAAQAWTAGDSDAKSIADFFGLCVDPATALRVLAAAREYDVELSVPIDWPKNGLRTSESATGYANSKSIAQR